MLKCVVFCVLLLTVAPESIAVSSKQVREVLKSELSTSVPVTSASSAIESVNYSQAAPLCQRLRDGEQKQQQQQVTEVTASHEGGPQPGMFIASLSLSDFIFKH